MGEINTVKCGNDEEVIIEYHPENKTDRDINITVEMLKTSPVGTKWESRNHVMDEDTSYLHKWELAYRDGNFGALIKHVRIRKKLPTFYIDDIVMDTREYIWYEF